MKSSLLLLKGSGRKRLFKTFPRAFMQEVKDSLAITQIGAKNWRKKQSKEQQILDEIHILESLEETRALQHKELKERLPLSHNLMIGY